MPPYILAVSWSDLLARNGLLSSLLPEPASTALSEWLYGLPGCVWVMVSALMPIVMIITMLSLRTLNPRLEEAARVSANWPGTLRHVTLPLASPRSSSRRLIVFLLAVGEVAVPMLLRYPVYPMATLVQFAAFYDFAQPPRRPSRCCCSRVARDRGAAYLRDRTHRLLAATPGKASLRVPLRGWRIPAALITGVIAFAFVLLPMAALLHTSLNPFGYARGLAQNRRQPDAQCAVCRRGSDCAHRSRIPLRLSDRKANHALVAGCRHADAAAVHGSRNRHRRWFDRAVEPPCDRLTVRFERDDRSRVSRAVQRFDDPHQRSGARPRSDQSSKTRRS